MKTSSRKGTVPFEHGLKNVDLLALHLDHMLKLNDLGL